MADGWLINDRGNYELTPAGDIARDETVATRCRVRLRARRGYYVYDATLGSRLHTIKHLRDATRNAARYVTEALQPLLDEGAISDVETGTIETDATTGFIGIPVAIIVPSGDRVTLGTFRLGAAV